MSPESYIASISEFAGHYVPQNWMACQGQLLPIAQYQPLFALIGITYGGDGRTNFALPDLRPNDGHGNKIDWAQANQPKICICVMGNWPPRD